MPTLTTNSAVPLPSIIGDFGYSPLAPAIWQLDPNTALQYRNLSLDRASADALRGVHWRSAGVATETGALADPDSVFSFMFVLAGKVSFKERGGDAVTLNPFDSASRFGSGVDTTWNLSHGTELIEITAQASGAAVLGFERSTPGAWRVSREDEASYLTGDGPRRFFRYRDLGVAQASGRRIHVHVVRATQAIEGGTGWHSHSMGQLFYVLRGWADLAVEHRPWVRMSQGDAMCVAPRMSHNVPGFSVDYLVLEMCIPADYDTVDRT
jgi:hypothetical protein